MARTEQLSTTTSQAAVSGPGRAMRTRTAWTRAKQSRCMPLVQAAAQGRTRRMPIRCLELVPLNAFTQEEAKCCNNLCSGHRRTPSAERLIRDPVDDPRHQVRNCRSHARPSVPKAQKTNTGSVGFRDQGIKWEFWKPPLNEQPVSTLSRLYPESANRPFDGHMPKCPETCVDDGFPDT